MWQYFNPNPKGSRVGDCSVRAISKAMNMTWEDAYIVIALKGFIKADMPSSNSVWGEYLAEHGFSKMVPEPCTTIRDFCIKYPKGLYVCALTGHVVCVLDGDYYDTWDSGDETVLYAWRKDNV